MDRKEYKRKKALEYYHSNKERILAYRKEYTSTDSYKERYREYRKADYHANPELAMYRRVKARAKRLGQEFTIDKEDIIFPETCPVFGMRLETTNGKAKDNSPSLDRIDNTKGYVKGNVRVISWKANDLKSNLTVEQTELLLKYMKGEI